MLGLDPRHRERAWRWRWSLRRRGRGARAARADELGDLAATVGEVGEPPVAVRARSGLGATRPLIMLAGDQLPRIC
jgi:hypothetical protein